MKSIAFSSGLSNNSRMRFIQSSARLPNFSSDPDIKFHLGIFIAFGMALLLAWVLARTTLGFEIRTVGANPNAARYAGMSVPRNLVLAMALSGLLAGAAGAVEVLGVSHRQELGFGSGYLM